MALDPQPSAGRQLRLEAEKSVASKMGQGVGGDQKGQEPSCCFKTYLDT